MLRIEMLRIWVAILLAFPVAACAANQDLAGFYERYKTTRQNGQPHSVHRVPRDGHMLYVEEFGPARTASGPPMLLMHGFPDSTHLYDRLAPLLAAERRVIAFDFLGWGNSDTPDEHVYDVASLRRDLRCGHWPFRLG